MPKWTDEQKEAIYKEGTNIIVSAGAGSGKTAVLTERVLEKVKKGISVDNLLILTFTKMAAKEMRERIGEKLKENGFTKELSKLDTADITTFDAYALSLVKKYHYYLNLSKDINIIDASVIGLYKEKMLKDIFEELYTSEDSKFLNLIKEYALKDDNEIFNFILNINNKLDLKTNKREYLDNYISIKYNEENIDKDIDNYTKVILNLINNIRDYLEYIDDSDYFDKIYKVLSPLLSSGDYDDIKLNLEVKLPIAKGVSDTTKEYKDKISNTIKEIKKLVIYDNYDSIKSGILKTKDYVEEIITIIKELDKRVSEYKSKYNYFEYGDISSYAIELVKNNTGIREEIKNNLNEIMIDEYQDTNDVQEEFIAYIKALIAKDDLTDDEGINGAIDEACEKYGVTLSDDERQQIVDLVKKINSLGIDLNGLVDYAESLYNSFKNGDSSSSGGIAAVVGGFFKSVFSSVGDFFKKLFS